MKLISEHEDRLISTWSRYSDDGFLRVELKEPRTESCINEILNTVNMILRVKAHKELTLNYQGLIIAHTLFNEEDFVRFEMEPQKKSLIEIILNMILEQQTRRER